MATPPTKCLVIVTGNKLVLSGDVTRRTLIGFAGHSRGDPLITNDVLYQLSYSGPADGGSYHRALGRKRPIFAPWYRRDR